MPRYELVYIAPGHLTDAELKPLQEKVKGYITGIGGRIPFEETLGRQRLAYPIKKVNHGVYIRNEFEHEGDGLKTLDQNLRLSGDLLRHLVTVKVLRTQKHPPRQRPVPTIPGTSVPAVGKPEEQKIKLEDLDQKLDELLSKDIV